VPPELIRQRFGPLGVRAFSDISFFSKEQRVNWLNSFRYHALSLFAVGTD
jgi:hypothetical protein